MNAGQAYTTEQIKTNYPRAVWKGLVEIVDCQSGQRISRLTQTGDGRYYLNDLVDNSTAPATTDLTNGRTNLV